MKNLLKLGQGPRPDLMFDEDEKEKNPNAQPDGKKKKVEFEKGIRTVRNNGRTNKESDWKQKKVGNFQKMRKK